MVSRAKKSWVPKNLVNFENHEHVSVATKKAEKKQKKGGNVFAEVTKKNMFAWAFVREPNMFSLKKSSDKDFP